MHISYCARRSGRHSGNLPLLLLFPPRTRARAQMHRPVGLEIFL